MVEMRRREMVVAIESKKEDVDQKMGKVRILIGCKYIFYMRNIVICIGEFFGLYQLN